jgi:hypothetical protein
MPFQLPCYPNVDLPYTGPLMRDASFPVYIDTVYYYPGDTTWRIV